MKKIWVLAVFLLLFLTGCSDNNIKSINYKTLSTKLSSNESFVLYLGDDDTALLNILTKVREDNEFSVNKLNPSKLNEEDIAKLKSKLSYQEPSIIFIIDGKDPSILSHITDNSITYNDILSRLESMNYVKKDTE